MSIPRELVCASLIAFGLCLACGAHGTLERTVAVTFNGTQGSASSTRGTLCSHGSHSRLVAKWAVDEVLPATEVSFSFDPRTPNRVTPVRLTPLDVRRGSSNGSLIVYFGGEFTQGVNDRGWHVERPEGPAVAWATLNTFEGKDYVSGWWEVLSPSAIANDPSVNEVVTEEALVTGLLSACVAPIETPQPAADAGEASASDAGNP